MDKKNIKLQYPFK